MSITEITTTQRLAVLDDVPQIAELMRNSILGIFPRFYHDRQTASAVVHVAQPDLALIEDGTYFVHEAEGEIVACGGWSRRNKLYTGSGDGADDARLLDPATEPARVRAMFVRPDWTRRGLGRAILEACAASAHAEGFTKLALLATLPGEQLYRAFGFREIDRRSEATPDGVLLECVEMELPIEAVGGAVPHERSRGMATIERVTRFAAIGPTTCVAGAGAWMAGAGHATAPEPARATQALSGGTGATAAAVYVNSNKPRRS